MKVHNRGGFHQCNICGCQVKTFRNFTYQFSIYDLMGFFTVFPPGCSLILLKFSSEVLFWRTFENFKFFILIFFIKIVKIKTPSSLYFPGKMQILLALFWLFLLKPDRGHKSNGQNQNSAYSISPTQFLVNLLSKNLGSRTFRFCGFRSQRTIRKNLTTGFQVWLLFSLQRLHFLK